MKPHCLPARGPRVRHVEGHAAPCRTPPAASGESRVLARRWPRFSSLPAGSRADVPAAGPPVRRPLRRACCAPEQRRRSRDRAGRPDPLQAAVGRQVAQPCVARRARAHSRELARDLRGRSRCDPETAAEVAGLPFVAEVGTPESNGRTVSSFPCGCTSRSRIATGGDFSPSPPTAPSSAATRCGPIRPSAVTCPRWGRTVSWPRPCPARFSSIPRTARLSTWQRPCGDTSMSLTSSASGGS